MNTIFCYKLLFDMINGIFCRNGKPLPGNYVTANKEFSDKFIYHLPDTDIHSKELLQHFSGQYFFPETFFSREKINSTEVDSVFFLKGYKEDNGKGIQILSHAALPPIVPSQHLVQPEIKSKLYHQRKFDIRVLVCVRRNGDIMIYKNFLYRINPHIFVEQEHNPQLSNYLTNTAHSQSLLISFFDKTHSGEFDTEEYLQQLKDIIPIIYSKLLPIANSGYPEDIENSFLFGGLAFVPQERDNKLQFLELNVTPGWTRELGLENYQEFYQLATNFILEKDQNTDECLYISINNPI